MKRPSWLRWPCVSAEWADTLQARVARREAERDEALAEIDALKRRVLATEARHDEAEDKRRRLARWLADEKAANKRLGEELAAVSIVNTRLTEDLTEAREELAEAQAQATDSLAGQLRAELKREKRRAEQLQKQYDDATTLADPRLENGRNWQQTRQDDGRKQATL